MSWRRDSKGAYGAAAALTIAHTHDRPHGLVGCNTKREGRWAGRSYMHYQVAWCRLFLFLLLKILGFPTLPRDNQQ